MLGVIAYLFVLSFLVIVIFRIQKSFLSPMLFVLFEFSTKSVLGVLYIGDTFFEHPGSVDLLLSSIVYILTLVAFYGLGLKSHRVRPLRQTFSLFNTNSLNLHQSSFRSFNILTSLIVISCVSFLLMFVFGKFPLSYWLSDFRAGYQFARNGVGLFFVLYLVFLNIAFIYLVYHYKLGAVSRRQLWIFGSVILFLGILSGSKRTVVAFALFYLIFVEYYVYKIPLFKVVLLTTLISFIFILNFLLSGNSITHLWSYFNYLPSTLAIFDMVNTEEIKHTNGELFISNIWNYIPRFIYPEKPMIYSGAYISELLSPGMVERGHFLGMLDYTADYLDFGMFGVVLHASSKGFIIGLIQSMFLINKKSFVLFVLFLSLYSPIMNYTPFAYFIVFLLLFSMVLRFFNRIVLK